MKRLATTAGFLALGAASLHAIYAPELTRIETGKPWTVAASLRGFYDDNYACAPSWMEGKKSSWGFEARPYIGLNLPMEQSYLGLSYLNSSRYYADRTSNGRDPWDFEHQGDLKFDHAFSPRYRLKVADSFLYSFQPDTVEVVTMPFQRDDLTYFRNLGAINFAGELTQQIGFSLSYKNTMYDYQDFGEDSYSSRLNRLEHRVPVDLRWQVQPDLVALVGYQYGQFDYTANEFFSGGVPSDARNFMSHTMYVGADYDITTQLRASARVGAQYNLYETYDSENDWTPYADLSLSYYYTVGSHVDLGFKQIVSATDVAWTGDNGIPTLNQQVSAIYALVSHQITPKLTGNLLIQNQWDSFYQGLYGDTSENLFMLSLYASYQFNQYLSTEIGYNYDWLDSGVKADGLELRSYTRNFVYMGFRARY